MKKAYAALFVVLLMASCSLFGGLEQDIIGTWEDDSDPGFTITFQKGGDLVTSENKTGTWKITGETLVVSMDDGGSTALIIMSIDDGVMILSSGLIQLSYTQV